MKRKLEEIEEIDAEKEKQLEKGKEIGGYSTVQKECKRISLKFGYCSREISSLKFRVKNRDSSGDISKKIR